MSYTTESGHPFSDTQSAAIDKILAFEDPAIILTGQAGSGKSEIVRHLRKSGNFSLCSTTGRSALLIGGCTVDRMFCFDRNTGEAWNEYMLDYVMSRTARKIIIDEASMIGFKMAETLYATAAKHHKILIMVGDWAQARPVKDTWPFQSGLFQGTPVIQLEKCFRQSDDHYLTALNDVRRGNLTLGARAVFGACKVNRLASGDDRIMIFATNKVADATNATKLLEHLKKTGEEPFECFSKFVDGRVEKIDKEGKRIPLESLSESKIEKWLKDSQLAHEDRFAIGCRLVITLNQRGLGMDAAVTGDVGEHVNGDTGTLVDALFADADAKDQMFAERIPWSTMTSAVRERYRRATPAAVVILRDRPDDDGNPATVTIQCMDNTVEDADGTRHSLVGLPIKLGYAQTIHKSQGMTLFKAAVDMSSILHFPKIDSQTGEPCRHGLAYVALSRTKTLEGLAIDGLYRDSFVCDPVVAHLVS